MSTLNDLAAAQANVNEWRARVAALEAEQQAAELELETANGTIATALVGARDVSPMLAGVATIEIRKRALPAAIQQAKGHLAAAERVLRDAQAVKAKAEAEALATQAEQVLIDYANGLYANFKGVAAFVELRRQIDALVSPYGIQLAITRYGLGDARVELYRLLEDFEARWPDLYARAGVPPTRELARLL